eukprot:74107-Hanusia_phi.AAC.1
MNFTVISDWRPGCRGSEVRIRGSLSVGDPGLSLDSVSLVLSFLLGPRNSVAVAGTPAVSARPRLQMQRPPDVCHGMHIRIQMD